MKDLEDHHFRLTGLPLFLVIFLSVFILVFIFNFYIDSYKAYNYFIVLYSCSPGQSYCSLFSAVFAASLLAFAT